MRKFIYATLALCAMACSNIKEELTIEQKAAKLLIVGMDGTEIAPQCPTTKAVEELGVSGVILFERNIATMESLKKLCYDLQTLSPEDLFIAIDQEGGRVNRMKTKYGFQEMISQKEAAASDKLARQTSATIASALAEMGINLNFSPCVDTESNPDCPVIGKLDRSFSSDSRRVGFLSEIYINEHHRRGILTSLKHFPGHGSSLKDSHNGFTDITNSWSEDELAPFKYLIERDLCDMIMVSHLFNESIDKEYPATLSKATIDGLLREKMGWRGVVITDDMQMRAITDHYGFDEAIVLAINAGVDLFIIGGNIIRDSISVPERFVSVIVEAIESGKITIEQLDKAVERIESLRERL
ncbi:MAG: glycoside hydrolase family 3 N-terminal domain-containing protein [Rikenellaceae bacterium]